MKLEENQVSLLVNHHPLPQLLQPLGVRLNVQVACGVCWALPPNKTPPEITVRHPSTNADISPKGFSANKLSKLLSSVKNTILSKLPQARKPVSNGLPPKIQALDSKLRPNSQGQQTGWGSKDWQVMAKDLHEHGTDLAYAPVDAALTHYINVNKNFERIFLLRKKSPNDSQLDKAGQELNQSKMKLEDAILDYQVWQQKKLAVLEKEENQLKQLIYKLETSVVPGESDAKIKNKRQPSQEQFPSRKTQLIEQLSQVAAAKQAHMANLQYGKLRKLEIVKNALGPRKLRSFPEMTVQKLQQEQIGRDFLRDSSVASKQTENYLAFILCDVLANIGEGEITAPQKKALTDVCDVMTTELTFLAKYTTGETSAQYKTQLDEIATFRNNIEENFKDVKSTLPKGIIIRNATEKLLHKYFIDRQGSFALNVYGGPGGADTTVRNAIDGYSPQEQWTSHISPNLNHYKKLREYIQGELNERVLKPQSGATQSAAEKVWLSSTSSRTQSALLELLK